MPASDPIYGQDYNVSLVPFPMDQTGFGADWILASSLVVTIPKTLINYYDQRLQVQLAGELLNAEAALVVLDTGQNPMSFNGGNPYFAQISQPAIQTIRCASQLEDWSAFFRTGQVVCFGVAARMIQTPTYAVIIRNLTAVLYFGSLSIGMQLGV